MHLSPHTSPYTLSSSVPSKLHDCAGIPDCTMSAPAQLCTIHSLEGTLFSRGMDSPGQWQDVFPASRPASTAAPWPVVYPQVCQVCPQSQDKSLTWTFSISHYLHNDEIQDTGLDGSIVWPYMAFIILCQIDSPVNCSPKNAQQKQLQYLFPSCWLGALGIYTHALGCFN